MGAEGNVGERTGRVLGQNPDTGWIGPQGGPDPAGKGWRLPPALDQRVTEEGDEGPCTPSRLIRKRARRPAEVLVDRLRSGLYI